MFFAWKSLKSMKPTLGFNFFPNRLLKEGVHTLADFERCLTWFWRILNLGLKDTLPGFETHFTWFWRIFYLVLKVISRNVTLWSFFLLRSVDLMGDACPCTCRINEWWSKKKEVKYISYRSQIYIAMPSF